MHNGYIKLYRSFRDWYGYKSHKRLALWVELLFCASHKNTDCLFKGKFIQIKPGQFITGRKALSSATGVSETQVERILNEFESIGQIGQQKSNTSRLITIVKWSEYQEKDSGRTTEGQQKDSGRTTEGHNQEYKNDKNNKKVEQHSVFTPPTIEEVKKYCADRNNGIDAEYFFNKNNSVGWVDNKGRKYKDWKAVIGTWEAFNKKNAEPKKDTRRYL